MAEIPSERIDAYERQLAKLREESRRYVFARFKAARANGLIKNDEDAMQVAHDALSEARQAYGDQAARAAADMYDATAGELGHDVPLAEMDNDFTDDEIWAQVRTARKASKTADDFIRHMANFAYDKTYNAARKTAARNAERDYDRGIRYARIPTGSETCGWCVMLASRGFVYRSRKSAGDYGGRFNYFHDRCDCRVQVGDENTTVNGYDPDWYLKVYEDAREACGSGDPKDIANEINRRNRSWVYEKKPGDVTADDGAKPKKKEIDAAELLASHGLSVHFLKPVDKAGKRTADTTINRRRWEMKRPVGDQSKKAIGKSTIDHQFEDAAGQSRRLILDASVIEDYPDLSFDRVCAKASELFYGKWSGSYDELMVLGKNSMRRYKK